MAYFTSIGDPPPETSDITPWAAARAAALLNHTALICAGRSHRICEVELYLDAPWHPDPFVHGAAHQERSGGWYFHRAGASYRGGTFKGLDFSTGAPGVGCGWLIRSIEAHDGRLIDGSCNVVDHLLAVAGASAIGPLDAASPRALDPTSRLHLAPATRPPRPLRVGRPRSPLDKSASHFDPDQGGPTAACQGHVEEVQRRAGAKGPWNCPADLADAPLATPRVGLTLKRAAEHPTMPAYIHRRLRFLTEPRRVKKGRIQTLAALLADGMSPAQIRAETGSPRAAIERAAAAFASGSAADPAGFIGRALSSAELYALYGSAMA